jgi:hypothetical protein
MTATYTLAEIPERLGEHERTVYRIARDGRPQGERFWNRQTAEQMLAGWQRLPEGYLLSRIQTGGGWMFKASKDGWKSAPSAYIEKAVAEAEVHRAAAAQRAAARTESTAAAAAEPPPPAPSAPGRACAGCGVYIPQGQGMIASLGLSCDRCYDNLSD